MNHDIADLFKGHRSFNARRADGLPDLDGLAYVPDEVRAVVVRARTSDERWHQTRAEQGEAKAALERAEHDDSAEARRANDAGRTPRKPTAPAALEAYEAAQRIASAAEIAAAADLRAVRPVIDAHRDDWRTRQEEILDDRIARVHELAVQLGVAFEELRKERTVLEIVRRPHRHLVFDHDVPARLFRTLHRSIPLDARSLVEGVVEWAEGARPPEQPEQARTANAAALAQAIAAGSRL